MSRIKQKKQGLINYLEWTQQDNTTATLAYDGTDFDISRPVTVAGVVQVPNGTAAIPTLRGAATNSGIYFGSGCVYFSTAGTERVSVDGQGDVNINGGRGIEGGTTGVGTYWAGFAPIATTDDIAAAAGGAISLDTFCTTISSDAGGDAFTLADGKIIGQLKKIHFYVDGGGDAVVTAKLGTAGTSTTLTFSDAGEYALLCWNGTGWVGIELYSLITVAHRPVIS
jgi:hypothetical protein